MIGVLLFFKTFYFFVRYTAIGDVLVAVNPYERLTKPQDISLYDSKVAWHYFSTVMDAHHVAAWRAFNSESFDLDAPTIK